MEFVSNGKEVLRALCNASPQAWDSFELRSDPSRDGWQQIPVICDRCSFSEEKDGLFCCSEIEVETVVVQQSEDSFVRKLELCADRFDVAGQDTRWTEALDQSALVEVIVWCVRGYRISRGRFLLRRVSVYGDQSSLRRKKVPRRSSKANPRPRQDDTQRP